MRQVLFVGFLEEVLCDGVPRDAAEGILPYSTALCEILVADTAVRRHQTRQLKFVKRMKVDHICMLEYVLAIHDHLWGNGSSLLELGCAHAIWGPERGPAGLL